MPTGVLPPSRETAQAPPAGRGNHRDSPAATGHEIGAAVAAALRRHGGRREQLVQILCDLQASTRWLPPGALAAVAQGVGLSPAIVLGVASFYRFFHLRPVGRVHLLWSDNVTDRHRGNRERAAQVARAFDLPPDGSPSSDGRISQGFASCTGLPDQGPAVLVNQQQVVTRLDASRTDAMIDLIRQGVAPDAWPAEWSRVDDAVHRADVILDGEALRGEALRRVLASGAPGALDELEASRLRGRGGAGFPTAHKWRLCRAAAVPEGGTRVVVCDADEGEPGTFKDRVLLRRQADTVLEGMTVAARLVEARRGFIYLRGEYRFLLDELEAVLARRRSTGLLGADILGTPGFHFDVEIHLGAGAYVCGEESALLESLEGKRGTPRIRPPFPMERGYLGQPTIVNNVETFCAAARIAHLGVAAWTSRGTADSTGTKLHSVSGDCERPGVYELPYGVSVRDVLALCGAQDTQAVQVGGPSGQCLAAPEFDRRLAFEDVPTAGAFTVFNARRDLFEVAHGYSHFFAHESCGFCTPCRVGTELVLRRFDKLASGYGSMFDEAELRELEALLHGTTHCGLGATATNPLRDTLLRFRPAYERRLQQPRFVPAFDLDAELAPARRATGRDDPRAHLERIG
jgi:[NiFe] hydrogenase diaphorase moiety large subunit